MKLIWFAQFIPFPPHGGNVQRTFNLIRQASARHEMHLIALNLHGENEQKLHGYEAELKKCCATVKICELPFPWRGAHWWSEALFSPLFRVPFSNRALFSKCVFARWKDLLKTHPNALLHFDSIDLALYADAASGFRKVLNHHNCESAMAYRQAEREKNPVQKKYMLLQAAKLERAEQTQCPRFDVNLVVSEGDRRLLQAIQPNAHYHIVANGVDTQYFVPITSEPEAHSVIFTGLLGWGPNVSAMKFLVRDVWPHVKAKFPAARLYLAGKKPAKHVLAWPEEDSSITVVPNPDDMRPWLARATVCVCPIREGGGTRLKILDAMAMGKPVVSTTIGCEGLHVTPRENILIADTPQDFAAKMSDLFEDRELQRRLGANGRALVEGEYSWDRIGQQLEAAYRHALEVQSSAGAATNSQETSSGVSR